MARAGEITHVVHASLDGLGALYLQFYITNAPDQFPNFVRLTTEGAFTMNARCDYDISETVPNHATMFTGRPVFQPAGEPATTHHGYNNNFPGAADTFHTSGNLNVPYKASFFDVAHDYGLSTALYTGKTRLAICERSYNETNGAFDLFGTDNGRDKIDFSAVADVSGVAISNEVNLLLQDLAGPAPRRYSFIHIAEPDLTGHASGWGSANWSNAVRAVDAEIGRILSAIQSNPVLSNNTALVIAADHGGGGVTTNAHTESYHITNYTIPFFLWAPGVPAGADLYSLFANRANPGTNRADYSVIPGPIRGGDTANLALSLLGLPPIPGSFFIPQTQPLLAMERSGSSLTVSWPGFADGFFLQGSESLANPVWVKLTNGVINAGSRFTYTVDQSSGTALRFFQLRSRAYAISTQPVSRTVFAGQPVAFSVETRGGGTLTYQWLFNGNPIAGAVASTFTLTPAQVTDVGSYRVVVSDDRDSLLSKEASLTVLTAPVITQQPADSLTLSNGVAQFGVQANGSGELTYQWRKDGADLPGETGSSLAISNVVQANDGLYSVLVTDANGSTLSREARLAVQINPVIVQRLVAQTASLGQTVTFTVGYTGNPSPFGIEWRRGSLLLASNTVNGFTASLTVSNIQNTDAGTYFAIVRNQGFSLGRATSAALTVTP